MYLSAYIGVVLRERGGFAASVLRARSLSMSPSSSLW